MICAFLLACLVAAQGQSTSPEQPPYIAQLTEVLARAGSGHSPTNEEIMAVESEPGLTSGQVAADLVPLLKRALSDHDAAVRQYGLAMLVGLQTLPDAAPPQADKPLLKAGKNQPARKVAARYQAEVGRAFAPLIPTLGTELVDEHVENRELAATDIGGFATDAPPDASRILLDFLKRDDATGPVGVTAVSDLFTFGPISSETAEGISQYISRNDLTSESRIALVDAISSKSNQSRKVNQVLAGFIDSDDAALRAQLILALPLLDLSQDTYDQLKARVEQIAAAGSRDDVEAVRSARAIAVCWTQAKMDKSCPED